MILSLFDFKIHNICPVKQKNDLKPGLSTFMLICGSLTHVEETPRTGAGPLETPTHS